MINNRSIILRCLIPVFLICASNINADQVIYFYQPPSSDEITRILFPKTEENTIPNNYPGTRGEGAVRGMQFVKSSESDGSSVTNTAERKGVGFPIAFDYNSSEIKPEGKSFLDELGKSLSSTKNSVLIIEGHTDAFGSDKYNLFLSERRARSVKNYLVENFNILPQRLRTTGLGESKPYDSINPYDKKNRRVEFFSVHSN